MTFDTTQALFFGGREAVRKEKMKPTGFKATRWRERTLKRQTKSQASTGR
jgi:hypothetical protein